MLDIFRTKNIKMALEFQSQGIGLEVYMDILEKSCIRWTCGTPDLEKKLFKF